MIALSYVLATSYAFARLLVSRLVSGLWELDGRFVADLLAVTLLQLAALQIVSRVGAPAVPNVGPPAPSRAPSPMGRFLVHWIALATALVAATAAVALAFRHLDLRYVTLVHLLLVPTAQAAIVTWVRRDWSLSRLARAATRAPRHPLPALLLAGDAVVLWAAHRLEHRAPGDDLVPLGLIAGWSGLQIAGTGGVLLVVLARAPHRQRLLGLAGVAVCCAVVATWLLLEAMGVAPDPLDGVAPRALRWLIGSAIAAGISLLALVRAAAAVRATSPTSACCFEAAAACLFALVLVTELNLALHPFLAEPWRTVAEALALGGASWLLGGAVLARSALAQHVSETGS